MATLAELQALAAQAVEESGVDLNEAVKGGSGGRLLPVGYAFGRLVEYIELGNQPQEFAGKAKDPALEFTLGFALTGTAPNGETYHLPDGTPAVVRTYNTAMSRDDRSRAFKLFKALNWKGTAKGYAQLIGEPILVKIVHVPKSKTDPAIVSRIDLAGFLPPLDPVTQSPYPIPAAPADLYRMFLWNMPTKEAWDSLYIDGEFEGKSRNRIQESVLAALDFQGSALQTLLGGTATLALPSSPVVAVAAPPASPVVQAPVVAATVAPLEPSTVAAIPASPSVPVVEATPVVVTTVAATVESVPVASITPVSVSPVVAALPVLAAIPAAGPVLPV